MGPLFSHSRLSNFENCPQKFHYRYVQKLPAESESIEGFLGKRVHEVLERLYVAVDRGHIPSLPQVQERYRKLWDEAFDPERVKIVRTENDVDHYRETGERCLESYYRRRYPFDAEETLGLEQRVTFSLDPEGRYRIQGILDRLARARDGAIEIHDYKTSARVPAQRYLDSDRQLALYQLGIAQEFGERQPVRLVWHFVARNQIRTSTRTPEQLEALRQETIGLIDRIHAEERFEPRTGPLCRWCEYASICPAQQGEARDERAPAAARAAPPPAPPVAPTAPRQLTLL